MLAWLKRAFAALRSPRAAPTSASRLAEVEALPLDQDDQPLLHLLHVSAREGAQEAADLARRRLAAFYEAAGDHHKHLAMRLQLAERHPDDPELARALEAAQDNLGHRAPPPPRGRAEVVKLPFKSRTPLQESLADTDPPAGDDPTAPMPRIEAADTDVDPAPAIPDDPTAQLDPKKLDLLRRLSS